MITISQKNVVTFDASNLVGLQNQLFFYLFHRVNLLSANVLHQVHLAIGTSPDHIQNLKVWLHNTLRRFYNKEH